MPMHWVKEAMAAFVMQYTAWFGPGRTPQHDDTLTIAPPPRSAMIGMAPRHTRNGASTFTPSDRAQSASVVLATEPRVITPALLTKMSRPPSAANAAAAKLSA